MKKILNNDYFILTIIFFVIFFISFNFVKGFISYDTYKMFQLSYTEYAKQIFFADGRIFSGLYILLANKLNITQTALYRISIILCFSIIVANIFYFKNVIYKMSDKRLNKYFVYFLSFITIFNFSYVDNLRFIEMPIIALSIFLYIAAAKEAIISKNSIKMFILLLLAVFMYQGTINVFYIMLIFFYLQNYPTFNKSTILSILKILLISSLPIFLNFLFIKLYGNIFVFSTRMEGFSYTILNIKKSLANLINVLLFTKCTMPKYFYFILILSMLVLMFMLVLKNYKKNFNVYIKIVVLLFSAIFVCLPTILLFKIDDINMFSIAGRLFWAIGSLFGLICIEIYLNTSILKTKIYKITYLLLILIYTLVLYFGMFNLMKCFKNSNDIDFEICSVINDKIESYEKSINHSINHLNVCLRITNNGLNKKYARIDFLQQSYMLAGLPIDSILEFYFGQKYDISYFSDESIDFEDDIYFYGIDDIGYLYMTF